VIALLAASALAADLDVRVRERSDGDPVAGAVVTVATGAATTGDDGRATLRVDDPGPWTLTVTAAGFSPAASQVVRPDKPVRVFLVRSTADLEVVVEGFKQSADPTRHTVDAEVANETPGTLDDAIRLVQSLPGVTVQREYSPTSGGLSVRGSQPGDSRYYLDGIEIPYLYHFNQYASVFPASQIDNLELFPSTFSARYGDAVGAVVEARSTLDAPEATHGSAHINFVMAGGDVRAPLPRGWWFTASGRRSYQDLAGEQTPQFTVWPRFHDFVLRAEHGDAQDGTGLFAVGAGDSYTRAAGELDVLDPLEATTTPSLAYQEGYQVLGVRRQWVRRHAEGRAVAALVHHKRTGELAQLGREALERLTGSSRYDMALRPEGDFGLDAGYELNASTMSLVVEDAGDQGVRVAEEAPALARGVSVDDGLSRVRGGLYGTAHLTAGTLRFMPGLRIGADTTAAEVQLAPRGAVQWRPGQSTMFKVAGGRYAQRPEDEHLIAGTGDEALPTTASWQISAGWEQAVAGRLEIGVDAYRKWFRHPLLFPIDAPAFAADTGAATGVEVLTRYRLREVFFLWGWLAVQQTTVTTPQGVFAADGDQLISGGVVASLDVGHVNLGARYRSASGLPFTQLVGSTYDGGRDAWVPRSGPTNGERLPTYHKLDLRAAYTFELRGWSLTMSMELWYVPPSSTQLYPTWNYDYTEQGWVVGPGVLPLLGARAKF